MAVEVGRGVLSRIRSEPEMIVIQVQQASDPDAAAAALERACDDICGLDAGWDSAWGLRPGDVNNPKWVSEVMLTGPGPMILIDGGDVPNRFLRRIPDLIARRLEEAGVTDAVVGVPKRERGPDPDSIPRAVALRLYPPPSERARGSVVVPQGWLDRAMAWLGEGLGDDDEVWGSVAGVDFRLPFSEAASYFGRTLEAHGDTKLWAGDRRSRVRMVNGAFLGHSNLVLAGGGPAVSEAELVEIMERLQEVARDLAPEMAQAFIDFSYNFGLAATDTPGGGPVSGTVIEPVCDELAFDAFSWQVLGPGHLARLGGPPPEARPLAGGRVEVAVGDPSDWMWILPTPIAQMDRDDRGWRHRPPPARDAARELGRRVLAPILLPYAEIKDIFAARYQLGEYAEYAEYAEHAEQADGSSADAEIVTPGGEA